MKIRIILYTMASLFLLASCKKNETDVANTSSLSFQVQTQNQGTGLVQWSSGTAHAASITAITPSATESNYNSIVSQDMNLFSASGIGSLNLPLGDYQNTQFRIELSPSGNGSSLHLEGIFNDGTSMVPVIFDISDIAILQVLSSNFNIAAGSTYKVSVAVDLTALTQGIVADDLMNEELNGQVLLSSQSNAATYNTIVSNLASSLSVTVQ